MQEWFEMPLVAFMLYHSCLYFVLLWHVSRRSSHLKVILSFLFRGLALMMTPSSESWFQEVKLICWILDENSERILLNHCIK